MVEASCEKFQIYIERLPHIAANKLEGVERTKVTLEYYDFYCKSLILQISIVGLLYSLKVINREYFV